MISLRVHGPPGRSGLSVLAALHGCNVGQRVLTCAIDKINGFTRQFRSTNCYKPLTNQVPKNGLKHRFMTSFVYPRNQRVEEIHNLLIARTRKRGDTLPSSKFTYKDVYHR
ncbi:hypothetical protein Y032_0478g2192 [Ancylostoma ceylanicum]|uniref:Uncharacterized protein n=1 Tax=Ancylostoma ceylanicum TaxID=53326 RepID=A0A016WVL8_9BILA|nr:hypothetical protein Y032_0478g2192 [Ancylostoma ceylanicum]